MSCRTRNSHGSHYIALLLACLASLCALARAQCGPTGVPRSYALLFVPQAGCHMAPYDGVQRFLDEEAYKFPDLIVQRFGGEPRIKVIVSKDGSGIAISPYDHFKKEKQGIEAEQFQNVATYSSNSIKVLLQASGLTYDPSRPKRRSGGGASLQRVKPPAPAPAPAVSEPVALNMPTAKIRVQPGKKITAESFVTSVKDEL